MLSFLAAGSFSGQVKGIDNLQGRYGQVHGPGSYTPVIPVTSWSFRLMIGAGLLAALAALLALWVVRRGRRPRSPWLLAPVPGLPLLPLAASTLGWLFTKMGRQPWLVFGQMKTAAGVSANSGGEVLASLIVLTAVYGVLAVIEVGLLVKYAKTGLPGEPPPGAGSAADSGEGEPLALVY